MMDHAASSALHPLVKINKNWLILCIVGVLAATGLAGCSSDKSNLGKASPRWEGSGKIPRGGGYYKVGNPYKIAGRTYYPKEQPSYNKVGIASWYGEAFHKRKTANGEWYDMNALTAAHPTLPLPSYVRVTNLDNNKSIVVRVNDRGPYAHDRIIDMSKRSAVMLGFQNKGLTKVRVQYLGRAPLEYEDSDIDAMNSRYAKSGRPGLEQAKATTVATVTPASARPEGFYVQAASFSDRANAVRLGDRLRAHGHVVIDRLAVGTRTLFRVRLGPIADRHAATQTLQRVVAAGQPDAHIVTP